MSGWDEDTKLTQRQIELAANIDPSQSNAEHARRQRLEKLQRDIAECMTTITDFDSYAQHARSVPLVGDVVGPVMRQTVRELRAKALAHYEQLQNELEAKVAS